MRCRACDVELEDSEATLRHAETGEYTDMCVGCLSGLDIPVTRGKHGLPTVVEEEVVFHEPEEEELDESDEEE